MYTMESITKKQDKKDEEEEEDTTTITASSTTDCPVNHNSSNNNNANNDTTTTTNTTNITPMDDIETIRTSMQKLHDTGINFTYEWRKSQLVTLRNMLLHHWDEYCQALYDDLHKCSTEAMATELLMIQTELNYTIRHLQQWIRPISVPSPAVCAMAYTHIQSRPLLGPAVLILGPFNYPISLVLHPTIGALAAGNPVVIKPSEMTPKVSHLLSTLISQYFPSNVLVCKTGGIVETTQLLSYPWGRIFFTGSTRVGQIVAHAAARTMTPITLECGGKSIAYIDATTTTTSTTTNNDPHLLSQIAQRIIWSKTLNAGQTCAATDTVICDSAELVSLLLPHFVQQVQTMFGETCQSSASTRCEMGRIVTETHTQRLIDLIQEVEEYILANRNNTDHDDNDDDDPSHQSNGTNSNHHCRIVLGGSQYCSIADRYVAPTIILNPPSHLRIMQEEIFGPILPIITVNDRMEAIQYIRTMNAPIRNHNDKSHNTGNDGVYGVMSLTRTPLCLYVFTNSDTVLQQMIQQVPAGSVVRNDCLIHLCSPYIPFGGLGTSGYGGAYHGKYTFDLFSHALPVMYRPYVWPRHILPMYDWNVLRCHPFTPMKKYITLHIAMRLPAIPVLHIRLVGVVLVLMLAIVLGVWFGLR